MTMIDTPKRRYTRLERLSQWQQQAFAHRSRRLAESEPLLRLLALRRSEVCQAETSELKGPTCWSTGRSLSGREFAANGVHIGKTHGMLSHHGGPQLPPVPKMIGTARTTH